MEKCAQLPQLINRIQPVEMNMSVRDLFHKNHVAMSMELQALTDIHRGKSELDLDLDLGNAMSNFDGVNNNSYQCFDQEEIECEEQDVEDTLTTAEKAPKKNAVSLMMSRKRAFVDENEGTNLNRKDELFNDLVKLFKTSRVDFSSPTLQSDGSYCLQALTNALWYITNDHLTINEASKQAKKVTAIPKLFEGCVGYNDIKRKKVKDMPLCSALLHLHVQTLHFLLFKPYVKSTGSWKTISDGM